MSTTQQCFSSTLHPNWTSYSPTNIPNAIIISKLILFYGFITKSVLEKDQVINDLTQVVSIDKYKQHASVFFSTILENLSDINIVSTHVNDSFNACVNNIKQYPKNRFPIINLLEILSEFRNAMTRPAILQSNQYFSELKSLSEIFLPQNNNPFHSISNINDIQQKLGELDATTLKIYLSLCHVKDINNLTIQSILFGSLFLAEKMRPLIVDKSKSPPKRWWPFGGKKSRRHRKRKRQRNRTSRQNK